jgi:hypothetical protein
VIGSISPAIEGSMVMYKSGGLRTDLDGFPSFELYRKETTYSQPSCVIQKGETNPVALALPAIPGLTEGGSHC